MSLETVNPGFEPVILGNYDQVDQSVGPYPNTTAPNEKAISPFPRLRDPHSIPGYSAALEAGFGADEVVARLQKQLREAQANIKALEAKRAGLVEKAKSGTVLKPNEAGNATRAIDDAVADAKVIEDALRSAVTDREICERHMTSVLTQQLNLQLAHLREAEMDAGGRVALATREHGKIANQIAIITSALNVTRMEANRSFTLEELVGLLNIQG